MAKKKFIDTLLGNFVKHFVYAALGIYIYELTKGYDPFDFNILMVKKIASAGLVAALPTLQNYFNPNDLRFGRKPKAKPFKPEKP